MARRWLFPVLIATGQSTSGGPCTDSCAREYACCSEYKSPAECRKEMDDHGASRIWQTDVTGSKGVLARAGCTPGCQMPIPKKACSPCKALEVKSERPRRQRPTHPTVCTHELEGRCDCANLKSPPPEGLVTYVWWSRGSGGGVQRCATIYIPPKSSSRRQHNTGPKRPVVVHFNTCALAACPTGRPNVVPCGRTTDPHPGAS